MLLTDTTIRNANNAKPKAKPYRIFDAGGLYLEIAPSGGKWWLCPANKNATLAVAFLFGAEWRVRTRRLTKQALLATDNRRLVPSMARDEAFAAAMRMPNKTAA